MCEDMEGETALFRRGEHPLNSKKEGRKGREGKQRERTSEGKEKAAMLLNSQSCPWSSSTPTQSSGTFSLTYQT